MTASIQNILTGRGIVTLGNSDCPSVRARVEQHKDGIFVHVEDIFGRASERVVADVTTASAIVESWARGDLTDPLMMSLLPAIQETIAPSKPEPLLPPAPIVVPAAAVFQPWTLLLGLDGEVSWSFDGSTWFGGNLSGCGRLGPFCLGALARLNFDSMLTGDSKSMLTNRVGVDLMAMADFPIKWDVVSLMPGVGAGFGWIRVKRDVGFPILKKMFMAEVEADDDNSDEAEYPETEINIDTIGMRVNAHLLLGFGISRRFILVIGISAEVLLIAHTAPFEIGEIEMSAEPRGFVRGVLGSRFGLP